MSREEFSRSSIARYAEPTCCEIRLRERDCAFVAVRVAGHLAENPVASACASQDDRRPKLRLGEIRERERDERHRSSARYDHAASSSGRLQSSASDCSLRREVSCICGTGSSSRMVTKARCERGNCKGSVSRTCPCSSTTASTVRIIRRSVRDHPSTSNKNRPASSVKNAPVGVSVRRGAGSGVEDGGGVALVRCLAAARVGGSAFVLV